MAHGGPRSGAGRKRGLPGKLTAEAHRKAAEGGLMPLDYLLAILRDTENDRATRMAAAKEAAPYVHAKLAAVTHSGDKDNPVEHKLTVGWQAPAK